jgi:hypothetical protein
MKDEDSTGDENAPRASGRHARPRPRPSAELLASIQAAAAQEDAAREAARIAATLAKPAEPALTAAVAHAHREHGVPFIVAARQLARDARRHATSGATSGSRRDCGSA